MKIKEILFFCRYFLSGKFILKGDCKMLNFAICDDNVNILDKFSKILENIFVKHGYDAKVGISTNDVNKLLDYIDDNKTDVLILDINLKADKMWFRSCFEG